MPTPKGDFMTTRSGINIDPLRPETELIEVYDIAHALAHICRFGGHCRKFYSVAQHSVMMSRRVDENIVPMTAMWVLVHDAPEYILGDMVRPLKRQQPSYSEAEERVMCAIISKLGLTFSTPPIVKVLDNAMLATEARDLFDQEVDWHLSEEPLDIRIRPWSSRRARMEFLRRYREIQFGHPGTLWQQFKDYMGWLPQTNR